MPQFSVTITTRAYAKQTQVVEADSVEAAKSTAREKINDNAWEFDGADDDYEPDVSRVERVGKETRT